MSIMENDKEKMHIQQNYDRARKFTEDSREEWEKVSFFKEMFMGHFYFDLIDPFPAIAGISDGDYLNFYKMYKKFLMEEVDADLIDREGKIPDDTIQRLKEMKLFALKIGKEYGGLGFSQAQYNQILKLTSSVDANITALLSAHQSIGVPQPLILFGTKEQKEKYLTRISGGQISAFALTEANVGSDPAGLETTVVELDDSFCLNGEKIWCTNATIADVIVVMARHPEDDVISAFIVEMNYPGVKVELRCHFMGLRALENGVISFHNVKIPKENLIYKRGAGLKVALVTLNTGRLALPASISGLVKKQLEIARLWSGVREQWGKPIFMHEAIAHKISDIAITSFAIDTISDLATALYDKHQDIRLEAAVAKLFCSESGWKSVDTLLQIRGGRGYETSDSLKARGEAGIPVERFMRDFRINRIFEGTSEIMRLFIAREAVDQHLKVSGVLLDRNKSVGEKIKALPRIAIFYSKWYLKLWLRWSFWPRFGGEKKFSTHLRFIDRSTRKLARQVFHGMLVFGPGLQNKQNFLFRLVDIAVELYVMSACISKARKERRADISDIVEVFCQSSSTKINKLFMDLWSKGDNAKNDLSNRIQREEFLWLEEGIVELSQMQRDHLGTKPNLQNGVRYEHIYSGIKTTGLRSSTGKIH